MAVMGYKLTYDSGFAPNPYHGVLTLATCKPKIRLHRVKGDWIAGFVSKMLVERSARMGVHPRLHGLIYLAQITEDPITLGEYYDTPRFLTKRPDARTVIGRAGDNIYERRGDSLIQRPNFHHGDDDVRRDVSGRHVLVCERFYYFGCNAFIPEGGWAGLLGKAPARGFFAPDEFADRMVREFARHGIEEGIHGAPCDWNVQTDGPFTQAQPTPGTAAPSQAQSGCGSVKRSASAPAYGAGCGEPVAAPERSARQGGSCGYRGTSNRRSS